MDWSGCELVEVIEGKVSGVPLVVGTRIPADFVLESYESGASLSDIQEHFPRLSVEVIRDLIRYGETRKTASAA